MRRRLGDILIANGVITMAQLQESLEDSATTKRRLGEILLDSGHLNPTDLYIALAEQQDIEIVDLENPLPDPIFARKVPESLARRIRAIAISEEDGKLKVAMAEPFDVFAIDDLRASTGQRIMPALADSEQLDRVLSAIYEDGLAESAVAQAAEQFGHELDDGELFGLTELSDDGPIVKFIDLLLKRAIQERVSDIHVEGAPTGLRIRFRIDGVLHDVMNSPKSVRSGVLSRLKIMAEMDIAEKRIPPGWSGVNHRGQSNRRPTCCDRSDRVRRVGCAQNPRSRKHQPRPRRSRHAPTGHEALRMGVREARWWRAGNGPNGLGENHNALLDAQRAERSVEGNSDG